MNLTDEQKRELRIKVAELCGWIRKRIEKLPDGTAIYETVWLPKGHHNPQTNDELQQYCVTEPPDYPNSLDAMHEAEMAVIFKDGHDSDLALDYLANLVIQADVGMPSCATAAQRATAFVTVMEKS